MHNITNGVLSNFNMYSMYNLNNDNQIITYCLKLDIESVFNI